MSLSRKRFRPLDPAEEQHIQSSQRLGLEVLEDEPSYYFSWPDASLTALLASVPAYVQQHIYHKNVINEHENGSKVSFNNGAPSSSSDRSGTVSLNGLSRQTTTTPSTVPLASVPTVFDLRNNCSLGCVTDDAWNDNLGEFLQDMKPILHRVIGVENCSNTVAITMAGEFPNNSLDLSCPSQPKKSRKDNRTTFSSSPRCTTYEDSIFSLHAEQLSDVKSAGLIPFSNRDTTKVKEEQTHDHLEHVVVISTDDLNPAMGAQQPMQETDLPSTPSDSELCLQRRRVENEIVALEWRAFYQSKRTAAALRRLLSLEAAVPFEPLTSSFNEVSAEASGDDYKSEKCGSACESGFDVWREKVYRLWLHWRLCSAPCDSVFATRSTSPNHQTTPSHSALLNANCSSQETNSLTACFHTRYPWGPSLLVSAYLYDTQSDYFIDPQQSGFVTTPSVSSILPSSSASVTTPFVIPRRRGIYNFLRWRIELYMARLIQTRNSTTTSGTSSHSVRHECETQSPVEHDFRQRRSQSHGSSATEADTVSEFDSNNRSSNHFLQSIQHQSTLLGASEIDFLVSKEVLAKPLIDVEQDTQQNRLDVLECRDLKQDVEIWRGWLSKV
ncbi:unnamed protein product [Phytomonas sp. EM1]|nr:unnamed protein product [Phytomonas sp. EM1]|eukprot:CCW65573.1 unnamed protein product [Phytomonas sp. isolate EM1]